MSFDRVQLADGFGNAHTHRIDWSSIIANRGRYQTFLVLGVPLVYLGRDERFGRWRSTAPPAHPTVYRPYGQLFTKFVTFTLPKPLVKSQPACALYAGCRLVFEVESTP